MDLKLLAISDTHLGEDCSVLNFPHGREHLVYVLRSMFLGQKSARETQDRLRADEFILCGDISDRTLSSTSQVITHTSAMMELLCYKLDIGRMVYLPGNHDHTLWTSFIENENLLLNRPSRGPVYGLTPPEGRKVEWDPALRSQPGAINPACADDIIHILLGSEYGWLREEFKKGVGPELVLANPLYSTEINGRLYLFTHGTHVKTELLNWDWAWELGRQTGLDRLLGGVTLLPGKDLKTARDLDALEREAAGFTDSLWPSSGNNPTGKSDQLWYLLGALGGKWKRVRDRIAAQKKRGIPGASAKWTPAEIRSGAPGSERVPRLLEDKGTRESIDAMKKYFLPLALDYLPGKPNGPITFVYGDTHNGGFGEETWKGREVRWYNLGSWLAENPGGGKFQDAGVHPSSWVFAVDSEGREYFTFVKFTDQFIGGDSLISLAAADFENRRQGLNPVFRAAADASGAIRGGGFFP